MGEIILFVIAIILYILMAPLGFFFTLLPRRNWGSNTKEYLGNIAYSIDQHGNVICERLFNWILIKDNSKPFGNPDETISSVLGKNKVINNLTIVGSGLDWILNMIDPNHSINSIEGDEL